MEKLLNPDTGLMIWTIVTFLALVFILKKAAWGPLLHAIEEREARIRADLEGAEKARAASEKIKTQLDDEMAGLQGKCREILASAQKDAEALRAQV
jgi:F-type H+-transporting ATPase subunit b